MRTTLATARRVGSACTGRTTSRESSRCGPTSSAGSRRRRLRDSRSPRRPQRRRFSQRAAAELDAALSIFDEASAQAVLDRLFGSSASTPPYVKVVAVPSPARRALAAAARSRSRKSTSQAGVVRGRLMAMARGWGAVPARSQSSPAPRTSSTTFPFSSAFSFARTGGASGTSEPTHRCRHSCRQSASSAPPRLSRTAAGVLDGQSAGLQEVALHAPLYVAGAAASEARPAGAASTSTATCSQRPSCARWRPA